jgi:cytochrome c-type biogenesis protein CcmH
MTKAHLTGSASGVGALAPTSSAYLGGALAPEETLHVAQRQAKASHLPEKLLFRGSELQLRHKAHSANGLQPLRNPAFGLSSILQVRKSSFKRIAFLSLFLAFAIGPLGTAQVAAQSARAKEIGMHLKCMCKGCDMTAGGCAHPGGAFSGPCETAKAELREIDEHLANGESEQQIIDAFVREYGTIVYVEPPKHGFGLVAWLMPVVYVVVGLTLVILVVRKWTSRKPAVAVGAPSVPGVSTEALARARAQAARDTED